MGVQQISTVQGVRLHPLPHREEVVIDAPSVGGEAVVLNHSAQGQWSLQDQSHHINFLELKAVWLALQ